MSSPTISGTYSFLTPESRVIIDEAYERIGIKPKDISGDLYESADRSLNFLLKDFANKGINLWTIRDGMLSLTENQRIYSMDSEIIDIKAAFLRTSTRQLNGFASASQGVAENAFDGDSTTSCIQTLTNGWITYTWESNQTIQLVGVQSNATIGYTLGLACFNGGIEIYSVIIPKQTYTVGEITWIEVPVPTASSTFMIYETGGEVLDIQELYFNNQMTDIEISRQSDYEYSSISSKGQSGTPSVFWFDKRIQPSLYIWPCPTSTYNNLYYKYWVALSDVGEMTNSIEIPSTFLQTIVDHISVQLAIKNPTLVDIARLNMLIAIAKTSLDAANATSRERVPTRIYPDMSYLYE